MRARPIRRISKQNRIINKVKFNKAELKNIIINNKGVRKMELTGRMPIIIGERAKQLLAGLRKPTYSKEFISKCEKDAKEFFEIDEI